MKSEATCPHCSYVRGSNWRACVYCRIGMRPQPTAAELVEDATTRVIEVQTRVIADLRREIATLKAMVGQR